MCVCSAPAKLARTIVYAGLAHRDDKLVHVIGYQNQATNLDAGANCMILHIPSAAPMSPDNMVDTTAWPSVLEDLARAARQARTVIFRGGPPPPAAMVHVFQKGIYTVVLADRWDLVHEALDRVPAHQRPAISADLLRFYGERFPGWHLALCCFDNREATVSTPLLWWFEPLFPDTLMAPAIDSHTGDAPELGSMVQRDHELIFGTALSGPQEGELYPISLNRYDPGEVVALLPSRVLSERYQGPRENGDFLLDVAALHQGKPKIRDGVLSAQRGTSL